MLHPGNGGGVRYTSRLISRLRHRQFGVLVTTSPLDAQAYKEIREDGHPVVVLAGRDIVDILKKLGFNTPAEHAHPQPAIHSKATKPAIQGTGRPAAFQNQNGCHAL